MGLDPSTSFRESGDPASLDTDSQSKHPECQGRRASRLLVKLAIILAGIVVGQVVLYGPSLAGRKILLPLDFLAKPKVYLPMTPAVAKIVQHDHVLSDLVCVNEISRRFAVSEIHAGRFPRWAPYQYAGSPFVVWPKFSPFMLLSCCTASPVILAWTQLLAAIVTGLGAWLFCRRVLSVGFWPATVIAWCYPLTGFFVFWQGHITSGAVVWLPWLLLAIDKTIRQASPLAAIGMSAATCLVLICGQLDVAGQVLLTSGLYAAWCLTDVHPKPWFRREARRIVLVLAAGWGLGLLLAAPHVLPQLEYAQTGARMARRGAGAEERPPVGLSALPQTVLPDMYGATREGSIRIMPDVQPESSAAAYAGVIATLLLAPLAWCSRRHRSINLFWVLLAFLGLGWCLDVPGLVDLLRLPGLNMMSHNRFVFAASFALLALAAVGLETLERGWVVKWRWWFWLPTASLTMLCVWCAYRTVVLPEPLLALLAKAEQIVREGGSVTWIRDLDGVRQLKPWFFHYYTVAAVLCGLGVAGWLALWIRQAWRPWTVPVLGVILVGDLLWFGCGRSAQCDPALYYPRLPVLEEIAKSTPGRIVGFNCLPAALAQTHGLCDIRGYDAVDPARLMKLMSLAIDPHSAVLPYALTQWFTPRSDFLPPDGIRLSPILDMLGVRTVIFRGSPPETMHPAFQGFDYWVLVNQAALPRAFVPARVETVINPDERLWKLAAPQFDPRAVAYVESPVNLPDSCRGSAKIVEEIPTRVTVSVQMETPGLVVLADLWDKGWRAYLDGQSVPILRANHAVRGVVVPVGTATLEFRYEPASLAWGLRLSGFAAVVLLCRLGILALPGSLARKRISSTRRAERPDGLRLANKKPRRSSTAARLG